MAGKNGKYVDVAELGRAIKTKRTQNGLSLRDVADVTKVSASTLSRIENGTGKPDTENIAALTKWLDMPIDRVIKSPSESDDRNPVVYYGSEPTPDIVRAHLRADPNLDPQTAAALSELFTVAYNQMKNRQNPDGGAESEKK